MAIVSINNLRKSYNSSLRKYPKSKRLKITKFNYLNLSIHFSRDDREFDIHNYDLLKNLFRKESISKSKRLNGGGKISGFHKYLFSFKESNYLPNKKLIFIIFKDFLSHIKQFLDILGIFLVVLIYQFTNCEKLLNKKKYIFKNKKIFGITYWQKKKSNSAIYYYPGIKDQEDNKVFVCSFADIKSFSYGLISALLHSDYITPANVLNIYELFISILELFHLYLYDLYLVFFKKEYRFLNLWTGWKKGAEIFYSLLIYNSMLKISKNSIQCEFITWYENHITNRSLALAVSYSIKNFSSSCELSTFNGTPFNQNIPNHILPIKSEYDIGFYGQNYYVQDESSSEELQNYLKKEKINISVNVVPNSMLRAQYFSKDNLIINKTRSITIFTHASYWDLIACLLSIFNEKNKSFLYLREIVNNEKVISIRLHPALREKEALNEIYSIKEIPSFIKYKFIDNNQETFLRSLSMSEHCFFGISSYVNFAIEQNAKVFSVQTSHINNAPIKKNLLNASNLIISPPWDN